MAWKGMQPGIYTPSMGPALTIGDQLLLFPRKRTNSRRGSDSLFRVVNQEPITQDYIDLGALAAVAAAGASVEGTKISLEDRIELSPNRIAQIRFQPMLDFEVEFFQPSESGAFQVYEGNSVRGGWQPLPFAGRGGEGRPEFEFWHFEDQVTSFRATNPHKQRLPKTPMKIWGWAYELQPRSLTSVLNEIMLRTVNGVPLKQVYDGIGAKVMEESGDPDLAAETVLLALIKDRQLHAHLIPVERRYEG